MVQCLNTMGSFHCGPCPPGMQKDNEFISAPLELKDLILSHLTSSYVILSTGYEGDGKTCTQTNICATNNGGCYPLATCSSNPGRSLSNVQYIHNLTRARYITYSCSLHLRPAMSPRGWTNNESMKISWAVELLYFQFSLCWLLPHLSLLGSYICPMTFQLVDKTVEKIVSIFYFPLTILRYEHPSMYVSWRLRRQWLWTKWLHPNQ